MNRFNFLLCTDLDRTLLPNGTQAESSNARQAFTRLTADEDITLVYVTGRHKALVQRAIKCYSLPQPALVISDVGTKIYDLRSGNWEIWPDWETEIAADWVGLTHTELSGLFRDLKPLQLQEREKQNTHKLSYYVPLHANQDALIKIMEARLETRGVLASLIWSVDEPAGIGLLDVLPRGATKLHAIQFLRERLGFSLEQMLFAGDSGNDLPVLTSPVPAVLVANAADSVRDAARDEAGRSGNLEAIYFATGGFMGMNGNYSAGILEGVAHYSPELRSRLLANGNTKHGE
jgi:sucrose-6F-phosphate phosphohydrolase